VRLLAAPFTTFFLGRAPFSFGLGRRGILNFQPMDRHFRGSLDAELHGVSVNIEDANNDIIAYDNRFL
jgi:hypothetical protein